MIQHAPLRLHHVGYVVKQIASIAQSYIARYGYRAATPIIHDPLQTAFVQFLALDGDAGFLEFVAPDGPESQLSNAARKRGGLHHLCYTVDSLEDAIASLEATGMHLVSPPKPATAFAGRQICWLLGEDPVPIELLERRHPLDLCIPGTQNGCTKLADPSTLSSIA